LRLLDLHLKAFGPFTDRRLDLSGGTQGLHLVFGPNEAGKSSALRALKTLLYGFPLRSTDDFLHPKDQLRVGARLRFADSSELEVVRRKGNKATLLAPGDETPLDESVLARCLQGIDEKHFSSFFGLDHDALIQGGQELLAQKGDVGQALFAAGLGTRNLHKILQDLDAEAETLFLPRGAKPRINAGIAAYREAKKALADLSLSGREWDGKQKDLEKKRSESAGRERDLAVLKAERNRLQRIRRVQPRLGERRGLLLRLEEMGAVILLPADFADRRRKTLEAIRSAVETGARAAAELSELRGEADALLVSQAVLDQAETIERLHQGVELYAKGLGDRSRLLGERSELRAVAEHLFDEIRPGLTVEEAEALRPALDRWLRIQELGNQRQALWNAWVQARREVEAAEQALDEARKATSARTALCNPSALRRRIEAARKAGDLDRMLAEAKQVFRRDQDQLQVDLGRLRPAVPWHDSPEDLEALPVPGEETLRRFQDAFDSLAERRRSLADQIRKAHKDLADQERRLDEIRRGGTVPTEAELMEARVRRDDAWTLVRQAFLEKKKVAVDPAGYERSVEEADEIADRLRREAGRVQEQAQLLAHREQLGRTLEELQAEDTAAVEEHGTLQEDWKALWSPCGLDPLPPREMHPAWTARHEKLRTQAESLRTQGRRIEALRETRAEHRAAVVRELTAFGEPAPEGEELEPVLALGEERVRELEQEMADHRRVLEVLSEAEAREAEARAAEVEARAALEGWQEAWGEAIHGLGLGYDALPSEVLQIVETLRRAFASLGDAAKLDRRIVGLERDLETFRTSVHSLAVQIAPDLADRPAEQTAVQLQALLTEARRRSNRREVLDRRTQKLEEEIRGAEATRRAMEDHLARLVQEAGCADEAGLEEAERRSALLQDLMRDLERIDRQLLQDGEGMTLADLESEAAGIDIDSLPGRIDQLDREIEELERRVLDLREELGKAQEELSQMKGGDAAAQAAEQAQEVLAGLREDVERYARVRLAAAILRREIERYRAENQDPLLRRAGELFATLTVQNFTGLRTDFGDRDEPVLVGLRQNGRRVRVEAMSEGTRDQLYLALRLATLERYLAHAEPLPFIVDDILINFDDERSEATLKALAELSAKTQVILFTHHAHLRDLAAGLKNGAGVFVRELG
jgi:uncharacterized protein YhaN